MSVAEVSQLEFAYPGSDFRIRIDRFGIDAGSRIALIGPSGSGKSTLLNLAAGIILPQSGTVMVEGHDVTQLSPAARSKLRIQKIGMVFQSFELLDYLNVLDNLLLTFRLTDSLHLDTAVRERAIQLAAELEISGKLNRYPKQLSQGERQRVAIGRALVTEPALLLADEPTGNLDPNNKNRVLDLMLDSAARHNVATIMVTHDHGLLDRFENVYEVRSRADADGWAEMRLLPSQA
ncbi:MAG TPA: ABC transporter ATP-binding protein [Planctomycetaceae bacterium]|nr:ABC transporter ATP-binding protein [Planctomycetaceae bacterium]